MSPKIPINASEEDDSDEWWTHPCKISVSGSLAGWTISCFSSEISVENVSISCSNRHTQKHHTNVKSRKSKDILNVCSCVKHVLYEWEVAMSGISHMKWLPVNQQLHPFPFNNSENKSETETSKNFSFYYSFHYS